MKYGQPLWVLGHRVTAFETEGNYAFLSIISLPDVPGPPPHLHNDAAELFYITRGKLEVMHDGSWVSLSAGESYAIPQKGVHTFRNPTKEEVHWITSFYPRNFEKMFLDFGIPVDGNGAFEKSVSDEVIQKFIQDAAKYDMIIHENV